MKVCKCCKRELDESAFGKDKRLKCGLKSDCQECLNAKERAKPITQARKNSQRVYAKANREIFRVATSKYKKNNPDKTLSNNAARRQLSKMATLKGYEKEIENFYWLARDLKSVTGEDYHVDHIVPLRGKDVCGLHVPWNLQILPADVNLSKGNSFDAMKEEM
jgi:hypothetical protein